MLYPLFRYYMAAERSGNNEESDSFYTINKDELGFPPAPRSTAASRRVRNGWLFEGVECLVFAEPTEGTVPLYRWNRPGNHYYTLTDIPARGYESNGIACYVYPEEQPGTVPFWCYYSRTLLDHLYTTDPREMESHEGGYTEFRVMGWVIPAAIDGRNIRPRGTENPHSRMGVSHPQDPDCEDYRIHVFGRGTLIGRPRHDHNHGREDHRESGGNSGGSGGSGAGGGNRPDHKPY